MLRITGGVWRGRKVVTPAGEDTRPSMDMHRQSLFNILGQDLTGERVLDLFAGSGAFSWESLSRGAAKVVLIENGREALAAIRKTLAALAPPAGAADVRVADCYAMPRPPGNFEIVFVAPPYPHFGAERHRLERLLTSLTEGGTPVLAPKGLVIVQSNAGEFVAEGIAGLEMADRRRWGRTDFTFLRHPRRAAGTVAGVEGTSAGPPAAPSGGTESPSPEFPPPS